jgi:NADH-quinone oxidoreductase subunit E
VKLGGTTADGKFTVIEAECLAACGGAPCMWVEGDYYENLTTQKADEILDRYAGQNR